MNRLTKILKRYRMAVFALAAFTVADGIIRLVVAVQMGWPQSLLGTALLHITGGLCGFALVALLEDQ